RPPRCRRRRVPDRRLRGRGHPPRETNPAVRARAEATRAQRPNGLPPRVRTRSPHDQGRHPKRAESVPGERPSNDGGAHRRSSRRSAASPRSATAEGPGGPQAARRTPRRATDARALVLEPVGRDPEVGPRAFLPVAVLDEHRGTSTHPGPLEAHDGLRHDVEVVSTNLLEAVEGHTLRVDVDHLATRADDVPGELQAEVRLAAPRLPVQERDATFLDSPAQEVVQGPRAQGYLHCLDKVAAPFKASKSPPEGA